MPTEEAIKRNYEDIQDIDLSGIRKKRFRIDGDDSRILELNVSDMGIASRLSTELKKLQELLTVRFGGDEDPDFQVIEDIDKEMRASVDRIFEANVSAVCAPSGTLVDPINGQLRYEYILDVLTKLYESNLNEEFKRINARIKKHTNKYAKKGH